MKSFKVLLLSAGLLFGGLTLCYSIWPLDWLFGSTKVDVKNLKNSVDKNFSDIAAGINDNKTGINDVSGKVKTMSDNVLNLSSKITATAQVPVTASVGYQHDNSQLSAGRDTKQINRESTVNDTGLMATGLGVFGTMTGNLLVYVFMLSKQRAKVEERLLEMMKEKDEDYQRLAERNNANFERLLSDREEYRTKYLALVEKNPKAK